MALISRSRWIFLFIVLFNFLFISATPKFAFSAPRYESAPEDMLILELFLKDIYLDEAFVVYQKDEKLFIPLQNLLNKLRFPVKVNPVKGTASGWFIETSRTFEIHLEERTYFIGDQEGNIQSEDLIWTLNEVLISTDLLSKWFPVQFSYNSLDQTLSIKSTSLLPIEEQLAREMRNKQMKAKQAEEIDPADIKKADYSLFSIPNTDIRLKSTASDQDANNNNILTTLSKGDLLYNTFHLFTVFDGSEGLKTARMSLGRADEEIAFFDFFDITAYEVGDVFLPATDMINNSNYGVGFRIENFPYASNRNTGTIPINGILEPGWEVELYRNELLLDYATTGEDGTFSFNEVPLRPGLNEFVLKFFGPTGEKREKIIRHYFSTALSSNNHLYYRLYSNQHKTFIYTSPFEEEQAGFDPSTGKQYLLFELEYTLMNNLAVNAGHITSPIQSSGVMANYNRFGIKTSLAGVYTTLDHVEHDESGGSANQISLLTRINTYSLLGKYQSFEGEYDSDQRPFTTDPIASKYELRLMSYTSLTEKTKMVYSVSDKKETHLSGGYSDTLSIYTTIPYAHSGYSNRLYRSVSEFQDTEASENIYGTFSTRHDMDISWSLKSDFGYDLSPDAQADSLILKSAYKFNDKKSVEGRYGHYFAKKTGESSREASSEISLQYNHKLDSLTFGAAYINREESSLVSLNISSSLGKDSVNGDWLFSSGTMADKGFAVARVFFDNNKNGEFDSEDTPIQNAKIKLNKKHLKTFTNEQGSMLITNMPAYQVQFVELDESSLDAPFWYARNPVKILKLHPGATMYLDFIIEKTGEIEGEVTELVNNQKIGLSGVNVELYDIEGNLFKTVQTFFDGFFLFDRIPEGEYFVKISNEQMEKSGYIVTESPNESIPVKDEDVKVTSLQVQKIKTPAPESP